MNQLAIPGTFSMTAHEEESLDKRPCQANWRFTILLLAGTPGAGALAARAHGAVPVPAHMCLSYA